MTHRTGYQVYLFGVTCWHRTLGGAIRCTELCRGWCDRPQVIEIATGRLVYGSPQWATRQETGEQQR